MDDDRQYENGRHKVEYYRGAHSPWNADPQHQIKEQNALVMNKKIRSIMAERQATILEIELEAAISAKNEALAARDVALRQRDEALAQRDNALLERDNALAALQCRNSSANFSFNGGNHRGSKRMHHSSNRNQSNMTEATYSSTDMIIRDASPVTVITSEAIESHLTKMTKDNSKASKAPTKVKMGEDLNRKAYSEGTKIKSEWDRQDVGLNLITFDETVMPVPICTCTGAPRQCYKWGNGGWQSSCCTTTLSMYPLPQLPNKRHARIGGRKMSGSVFTRLLSRFASEGHDLSIPLDLKDYWARHGTNRYITIK